MIDKYIKKHLSALNKATTEKEKATILDQIYSDGFQDGYNEGCLDD